MHINNDKKNASASETITKVVLPGIASGTLELLAFHPVDTVIKRMMVADMGRKVNLVGGHTVALSYNEIIFRDQANATMLNRYKSLFPGFKFALGYKVLQRTYKFGLQPVLYDAIDKTSIKSRSSDIFGAKYGKVMVSGLAGAILGVGEVMLLPLDVLKIKMQTNPDVFKNSTYKDIKIKDLYKGSSWTAMRNGPGSFALFGTSAFVSYDIFGLERPRDGTVIQTTIASCAGAAASITIAQPLDVIKTRIQKKDFKAKHESGLTIIKNMVRNEGISAFAQGLSVKLATIGPKLAFSLTVAQVVTFKVQSYFSS